MSFVISGVSRNDDGVYQCNCCGYESKDVDAFGFGSCWACNGGNESCATCIGFGVTVSQFRTGTHAHLLADFTRTRCGLEFAPAGWTGAAQLPECATCHDGISWDETTGRLLHHGVPVPMPEPADGTGEAGDRTAPAA